MHSLRARLLASVLVLAAVGLVLLGGITYVGQRSFLLDRLDDQIAAAPPAAAGAFGVGDDGDDGPARRPRGGGGPPPGAGLPPGTYAEHRDADGNVDYARVFDYDQESSADPALPAEVPLGKPFTVNGQNGDESRYRVYAQADRNGDGGITIVAAPLTDIDATLNRLLLQESLVIAGILVLLGLVAWVVVRVGLLPLDRIGHTAGAIAGGDLSHRVEATDPRSEVGRLGLAFNAMLDRLEGAFAQRQASEDRLRTFLADASHELRTPLASIRGYAELFRMGAASSPDEVARAMARIEGEATRMGVLVEDLLTLARLDEIAEAPHTAVDVSSLVSDAVHDARATAPDRTISLSAEGPGPAVVRGDAHQLRQVLGNLLRNALVHTPAGTPVDVLRGRLGRHGADRRPRPRPGPADRGRRRAVRALLARRGGPRARQGGSRPRPGHRRRDRRRPRRRGLRGERRRRRSRVQRPPPGRLAARRSWSSAVEQAADRGDLVLERLLAVTALVELEHRVDARGALLERDGMELTDDREDVRRGPLERGAHGVERVPDAVLRGKPPLDLGDVGRRTGVRPAEGDHGEVGGGHDPARLPPHQGGSDPITPHTRDGV